MVTGAAVSMPAAPYQRGPGKELEELLDALRVPPARLDAFEQRHRELTDRPRKLLHGDLHSKNFVVDRSGHLWTIDWELALVGDPLYDLATHLHLMGYTADHPAARHGRDDPPRTRRRP